MNAKLKKCFPIIYFFLKPILYTFFIFLYAGQISYSQKNKIITKKKNKVDLLTIKTSSEFYALLKKHIPDSASKYLIKNDSIIKKIHASTKNQMINDLGKAYEKNHLFKAALNQYESVIKNKTKIETNEEKSTLLAVIKLYSNAQFSDSLYKYVCIYKNNFPVNKQDIYIYYPYFIQAHFLKGNFDSVFYYTATYKKLFKVNYLPYSINVCCALALFKQGKYNEANIIVTNILNDQSSSSNMKVHSEVIQVEILSCLGKEKDAYLRTKHLYSTYLSDQNISEESKGLIKYIYANQLYKNGKFNEALTINEEAINNFRKFTLEKNILHARALLLSATIYNDLTDFGASKLFLSEANTMYDVVVGVGKTYYDELTYTKSYYLYSTEQYSEALTEIDQTLFYQKKLYGIYTVPTAQSYNLKGNIYTKSLKSEMSKKNLDTALFIYKTFVQDKDHPLFGKLYNDIGCVEQNKEEITESINSYLESLRIFEKVYGKIHPDISTGYTNVASLYRNTKEYTKSFQNIQKALMANCMNYMDSSIFSNPISNIPLSDFILLQTSVLKCRVLQEWADSLQRIGNENESISFYKAAVENYFFCLKIISRLRNSYVSEESKIYLTEKISFIYEDGINICRLLYRKTNDPSYIDKAFSFSEKSKAGLLLSAIIETNAQKISGIPDSLLIAEKKITETINKLDKDLFKELKKGNKADKDKVDLYKKLLFEEKEKQISYLKNIEKKYEKYYQLKYDDKIISISEVQNVLLDNSNKQLLTEYFVGKDSIIIFCISKTNYQIIAVKKDKDFSRNLKGLSNAIKFSVGSVFIDCSTLLYNQLLKPIEEISKKMNIIVVPDISFVGLPFQLLVKTDNIERMKSIAAKGKFSKLSLALYNNAISYEISAAVAIQNSFYNKDTLISTSYKKTHRLFILAPIFDTKNKNGFIAESKPDLLPTLELDTTHYNYYNSNVQFSKLPGSEQEAIDLIKIFKNKKMPARGYLGAYAQKKLIVTNTLNYYNYIHFATHGEVNLFNPELSGLYMNDEDTASDAGIMQVGSIYSLSLNADMVTLSSCESGLGKIINGEGIMGFTRAFTYAGAKSIVVSLWNVNDQATSLLMKKFYKGTFKKQSKSSALQKSQIKILKNKKTEAPYYWAPFILYGF